jgi:O-antigen/teichoic acid export membrane protein
LQDIRSRLRSGTIWISASRLLTNALGFVGTLVLARMLAPADFGLVALATSMLAILSSVTDLSLGSALVQHKNATETHMHTAWTLGLARAVGVAVLFCAAAYPAAAIYKEPRLVTVMLALGASILLSGLTNPRLVMLTKDLVFWQQFVLDVAKKLSTLIVSVTVALIFKSYWALILGTLAGQFVGVILSYTLFPYRPKISWRHGRELWSFSMWLTFAQMINTINWRLDHLLIGGFLGRPALGFYTMGDNLAVMPTREATAPISNTLFPAFSRLVGEPKRLASAYTSAQTLVTAIALPLGVGAAVVADPLVRLALGEKWLPAALITEVLASVFALQTLGGLAQPLAMAAGKTANLFKRDLQAFAFRVPFIIIGMLVAGLNGILFARAFTGSFGIILNLVVVKNITGLSMRQQLLVNWRTLVSVTFMAAVVLALEYAIGQPATHLGLAAKLAAAVATGAVCYVGASWVLWIASGRPKGPETEVITMAGGMLTSLRRRA